MFPSREEENCTVGSSSCFDEATKPCLVCVGGCKNVINQTLEKQRKNTSLPKTQATRKHSYCLYSKSPPVAAIVDSIGLKCRF